MLSGRVALVITCPSSWALPSCFFSRPGSVSPALKCFSGPRITSAYRLLRAPWSARLEERGRCGCVHSSVGPVGIPA